MARFSKQTLADYVQKRIDVVQKVWGFDPANGYVQVPFILRRVVPESTEPVGLEEANRAYGEFSELLRMAEEFDLAVDPVRGLEPTITEPSSRFKRYQPSRVRH